MEITKELFDKIAGLAKLSFSDEQREEMMKDMSKIITWVQKLEELDTEGVEPLTNMSHEMNVTREDKNEDHLDTEIVLKNAPSTEKGFIKVPKVIG